MSERADHSSPAPHWLAAMPLVFVFLWSTGYIGARLSAPHAEPMSFLTVRFILAAILLGIAGVVFKARWPGPRESLHAMVAGALIQGVYLGGIFWAVRRGLPAGVAALIVGLQPLMTGLLSGAMLGERVTLRHWSGLILGLAGVALVVWPKLTFSAAGITPATVAAALVATFSISLGSVYQKRYAANLDLRTGNCVQFLGGLAVVAVLAVFTETFHIDWNAQSVFAMAWLVVVLSVGAVTLLYLLIRHGEVSKVAGLFYLVPPVTAFFGWVLFGETLNTIQLAGMAVCMAATGLAVRPTRRDEPKTSR